MDDAFRLVERVRPIAYLDWGMWDALQRLAQQVTPLGYALPAVVTLEEWRRECAQWLDEAHGCNGPAENNLFINGCSGRLMQYFLQ